ERIQKAPSKERDEHGQPTPGSRPDVTDWGQRALLGVVTALIVARPLLPGEDPGRLLPTTGISGLHLVLLWLMAGVGWAVWRAWSADGGWRGGAIESVPVAFLGLLYFAVGNGDPNQV